MPSPPSSKVSIFVLRKSCQSTEQEQLQEPDPLSASQGPLASQQGNLRAQWPKLKGKVKRAEMFTGNLNSAAQKIWGFFLKTHAVSSMPYPPCRCHPTISDVYSALHAALLSVPDHAQRVTGKAGVITVREMTALATPKPALYL